MSGGPNSQLHRNRQRQETIQRTQQSTGQQMQRRAASATQMAGPVQNQLSRFRNRQINATCNVLIPEESILQESYATEFKENTSASKRKTRSKMLGSALRTKRLNAEKVEESEQNYQEQMEQTRQELEAEVEAGELQVKKEDVMDLAAFGNVPGVTMERFAEGNQIEVIQDCMADFMELNLEGLDFKTDKKFAEQSGRMEEVAAKTRSLQHLTGRIENSLFGLSEEEKAAFNEKFKKAVNLVNFYQMKKKVITNSYYRTHYNSEISAKYKNTDTLEQKNLMLFMWQTEATLTQMSGDLSLTQRLMGYKTKMTKEDSLAGEQARNTWRQRLPESKGAIQPEYGKNNTRIEDSRHAQYFRDHNGEDDPIRIRLQTECYRVTGEETEMRETFTRHMSNLPRLKAIQAMEPYQVQDMIEKLAASPQTEENMDEIARCRQANLAGMAMFKNVIKKQMNYLKRKYGNGFPLMTPEEIAAHNDEFDNDFTNMQGLSEFVAYCKKVGLFDAGDDSDQEMDHLLNYYQSVALTEGMARNMFISGSVRHYSDYKKDTATYLMNSAKTAEAMIAVSDTLHKEVRWGEPFEEG